MFHRLLYFYNTTSFMKHYLFEMVHYIQHFYFDHKSMIFLLAIGLVAGLLAQMILPGRGFGLIPTIIIGIAGAWLGSIYIRPHLKFIDHSLFRGIASATAGAMILIVIINIARGGKDRDKTHYQQH